MSTELAIREGQSSFDTKQLAALGQLGVEGASRADQAIFFHQCVRTGLDPFLRQIYMIERQGKQTIQTGIDGFRLIARRAADKRKEALGYDAPLWCGEDGQWREVWLSNEPPAAAKVTVYRAGQPFPAVALMREFRATKRDGSLTKMWREKPAHMISKCAEALALRMAFPQDLSGIYTTDEMGNDEPGAVASDDEAATTGTRRMSRASHEAKAEPVEAEVVEPEPAEPTEEDIAELNAEAAPEPDVEPGELFQ